MLAGERPEPPPRIRRAREISCHSSANPSSRRRAATTARTRRGGKRNRPPRWSPRPVGSRKEAATTPGSTMNATRRAATSAGSMARGSESSQLDHAMDAIAIPGATSRPSGNRNRNSTIPTATRAATPIVSGSKPPAMTPDAVRKTAPSSRESGPLLPSNPLVPASSFAVGEHSSSPMGGEGRPIRRSARRVKAASWVATNTPIPASRAESRTPATAAQVTRSNPTVGSSARRTPGVWSTEETTARRRCSPPDRLNG